MIELITYILTHYAIEVVFIVAFMPFIRYMVIGITNVMSAFGFATPFVMLALSVAIMKMIMKGGK